jgi:hypothetical protein
MVGHLLSFGISNRFHEIKHGARMAGGIEDAGVTAASHAGFAANAATRAAISVFQSLSAAKLHR